MSHLEIWISIIGMTLVTVVTRALFLMAGEHVTVPDRIQRALAAIILPEFLSFEGHFSFSPTNDKLMAGIAATACYLLTKRMVGMIVVGMGVYTALRLLG